MPEPLGRHDIGLRVRRLCGTLSLGRVHRGRLRLVAPALDRTSSTAREFGDTTIHKTERSLGDAPDDQGAAAS
jgi:hypothetical protein